MQVLLVPCPGMCFGKVDLFKHVSDIGVLKVGRDHSCPPKFQACCSSHGFGESYFSLGRLISQS